MSFVLRVCACLVACEFESSREAVDAMRCRMRMRCAPRVNARLAWASIIIEGWERGKFEKREVNPPLIQIPI